MGQKAILMAGLLTVALFACGGPFSMEETAGGEGALSGSQALQSGDGSACSMERSCAVLYIGVGNQFAEYPVEYTGELDENGQIPPEEVVSAMASLTGWSLDLAEPIFSGKGGITVSFADTSALFVGPPEEQREEFRVYDALQLDQTILDSLKKTLQCWAVDPELGDPDQVGEQLGAPGQSQLLQLFRPGLSHSGELVQGGIQCDGHGRASFPSGRDPVQRQYFTTSFWERKGRDGKRPRRSAGASCLCVL